MTRLLSSCEAVAGVGLCLAATLLAVLSPVDRLVVLAAIASAAVLVWAATKESVWVTAFVIGALVVPPLPVDIGSSGLHPALILAVAGIYAGLLWRNRWTGDGDPVAVGAAVLTLVMLASVAMALFYSGLEVAAGSAARVLLFAITPWLFWYMTAGPGRALGSTGFRHARILFACGVASALFACFDFVFQLPTPSGYSPQYIWMTDRVLRRAQGLFYDAGALGNMCAFFLLAAVLCIVLRGRRAVNPWVAAAGALPLACALVLSYSRAALLNVAAGVLAMLIVRWRDVKWFHVAVVFPAAVVTAAGLSMLVAPRFAQAWTGRLQHTIQLASAAADTAVSGRISTWETIASFTFAHPLRVAAGVGYKTLAYSEVLGRPIVADNTWVSVLVETGILGFAALVALNYAILRLTFRAARSGDAQAAFYGTWAFAFWIGEMVQMCAADLLTWWRLLPVVFSVIAMAALSLREQPA